MATTTTKIIFDEGAAASTPASGDVALYAKTDGLLYSKDDAGAETPLGGAGVADILDLPTAETDDTLVLAPDGAGGVEFRAEAGGSGGITTPVILQSVRHNGTATISAIPSGNVLIVGITDLGGTVTGVACTNVTFTQMGTDVSAASNKTSIWVGKATGTSGTSVTFTGTGTILNIIVELADTLTPTLDVQVSASNAGGYLNLGARAVGMTPGALVALSVMTDNASSLPWPLMSFPHTAVTPAIALQCSGLAVGYAPTGDASVAAVCNASSSGTILAVSIL